MKLIENWKEGWKFWSLRLGVLGAAITSTLIALPDMALTVWGMLPAEIKASIPVEFMPLIGVVFFALSMVARILKQNNVGGQDGTRTELDK